MKKRISSVFIFIVLLFGAVVFSSDFLKEPIPSNVISGQVSVSDGDSLKFKGTRIRLLGIDAPELAQTCKDENKKTWQCGKISKKRMIELTKNKQIICSWEKTDRYNRLLAICMADGKDIGATLVKNGLAVSYQGSNKYLSEQKYAKENQLGMWAGEFKDPKDWRFSNKRRR